MTMFQRLFLLDKPYYATIFSSFLPLTHEGINEVLISPVQRLKAAGCTIHRYKAGQTIINKGQFLSQ